MLKYKLGIPDSEFIRGKVPMTKQDIRILTIAKAGIEENSIIVDVGAGTGSLSIEAALQAPKGRVYAIERKEEALDLILQNCQKFNVNNIEIIGAEAPDKMFDLPELDVAIIGGSGSQLDLILDVIDTKLKSGGRIVLNCITLQTLWQCISYMKEREDYTYDTVQVQVSHFNKIGSYDMAKAENPIFIVTCIKQ